MPVNNQPLLLWQIQRIKKCTQIDLLVVATSVEKSDDELARLIESEDLIVVRGSLDNVLSRFVDVLDKFPDFDNIIRLTGDCPLFMPELCDSMLNKFNSSDLDYLSNTICPSYPDGCDIEIFTRDALLEVNSLARTPMELEHVTLGIYERASDFRTMNFINNCDDSHHRWTLDEEADLVFIRNVFQFFEGMEVEFGYQDIMNAIKFGFIEGRYDHGHMRNRSLKQRNE
jgi:spore coat polysaccharide biosynthesis protein SpsF